MLINNVISIMVDAFIFTKRVLVKFRNSRVYLLEEHAFHGYVGIRKDYFKSPASRTKDDSVDVLFQKVWALGDEPSERFGLSHRPEFTEGDFIVAVQPKELQKIPSKERGHWYRFLIRRPGYRGRSYKGRV